ncbi:MAG: hypothetical protein M0Q51_17240 [Bacteroidales bacterium]|nr:hypothetical protein [Bacteroidales bacterium]
MGKKDVSAIVSGAGLAAAFWVNLEKAARERGITTEEFYEAVKEGSPMINRFANVMLIRKRVAENERNELNSLKSSIPEEVTPEIVAGLDKLANSIFENCWPESTTRKGEAS